MACLNKKSVIIVGDLKTPDKWKLTKFTYLDIENQNNLFPEFSPNIQYNHYSRKNIGYLFAAQQKSEWIFETDDDNFLVESPEVVFNVKKYKHIKIKDSGWINPYKIFLDNKNFKSIWPRGFPLELIHINHKFSDIIPLSQYSSLYQGLANGNPDVDAIFRLVSTNYSNFKFKKNLLLHLNQNQITPINSQATWWHKSIFRLMYLPSFSTFRVTDILRGYIAASVFCKKRIRMSVFSPIVFQNRNEHNLLSDFLQERPLYESASRFMNVINSSKFGKGLTFSKFLESAYREAIDFGLSESSELSTLKQWNVVCDSLSIADPVVY